MTQSVSTPIPRYIMRDQVPGKIHAIMGDGRGGHAHGSTADDGPLLSRPGWVAVTLLVIAFNLMAVLPPAA